MGLEVEGEQTATARRGTASGLRGTASGQRGTASGNRGKAEDRSALQLAIDESTRDKASGQDDGDSSQESDEEDRKSQAPSLADSADGLSDLPIIMPHKPPT